MGQLLGLLRFRQSFTWRSVTPFLVGGILGLPLGIMTLQLTAPSTLRFAVGFFLIVYAIVQLSVLRYRSIGTWGGKIADGVVGSGGGFLGGFAGLSGPLPLIWLQLRGGPSVRQRMIYQPFNLIILILAGLAMLLTGQIDASAASATVYCLPATLIGTWIGLRFYSGTGERLFRNIVLCVLLISGIILVVQSAVTI